MLFQYKVEVSMARAIQTDEYYHSWTKAVKAFGDVAKGKHIHAWVIVGDFYVVSKSNIL